MPVQYNQLKPFRSMIVAEAPTDEGDPSIDSVLDGVVQALKINAIGSPFDQIYRQPATLQGTVGAAYIHFEEIRNPSWTFDTSLTDERHHLVVVTRKGKYVTICFSDGSLRSRIIGSIGKPGIEGLSLLSRLSRDMLNSAFVQGRARTLWLSGTHRTTRTKADSKVLSGGDLREALDPLGDQSYAFTAARSELMLGQIRSEKLGVAPKKSTIWAGPSTGWQDYVDFSEALFAQLQQTVPSTDSPLPVLAVPSDDLTGVVRAFDMAFSPPELEMPAASEADQQDIEYWSLNTNFEVTGDGNTPALQAVVKLKGDVLGSLQVTLEVSGKSVVPRVTAEAASPITVDDLSKVAERCRKSGWLKIWYESGHTFLDDEVYLTRFRDLPFIGFRWSKFDGIDIGKEKPGEGKEIGADDSLFCWLQRCWPNLDGTATLPGGWLACDDGAGEIADFIHIDEGGTSRTLSLIHVKAAHETGPDRGISVSDYEVVVAQAMKNLRFLDNEIIDKGLEDGLQKKIAAKVWHDRVPSDRNAMLAFIKTLGTNIDRRVVVVQPRLTQPKLILARQNADTMDGKRMKQLDTLLLSAGGSALAMGTAFEVVAQNPN